MHQNSNNSNNSNSSALWLCLHFADLPLEIFVRTLEELEEVPSAVVVDKRKVCFLNQSAKDAGIQIGNSMDTAYAISSSIKVFERNKSRETRAVKQLAQWAYQFTPKVSINLPHSLLLDIKGSLKLFKGLDLLKVKITDGLKTSGYSACLATGFTPQGTLLLARAMSDNEEADLASLSIGYMEAESWIIQSLQQVGINTLGALKTLPLSELSKRYGTAFTRYLQQLAGDSPDLRKFISPKPAFFSEVSFPSDVTETGPLLFPAKRLLSELCHFLTGRQLTTSRFTWLIKHRNHQAKAIHISLAGDENNLSLFLSLTQLQLEKISDIEEVDTLILTLKNFSPARQVSGDLFENTGISGNLNDQTRMLLNQLNIKLGPGVCFGLSLNNDHRPEHAWRQVNFTGNDDRNDCRIAQEKEGKKDVNPRPVYLLKQPRLLTLHFSPDMKDKFELLSGPERIDFGWWEDKWWNHKEDVKKKQGPRDYYIARHRCGSLYWVFRYENRWHLHGIFS